MKNLKKLASVALALVMTLALMAPAFAAEDNTATITIKNSLNDEKYDIYKILDMTVTGEGDDQKVAYSIANGWNDFFTEGDGKDYLDPDTTGNATLLNVGGATKALNVTDDNVANFASAALAYAVATEGLTKTIVVGTGGDVTQALPYGYYLTYLRGATDKTADSKGSLCSLNNVTKNVELKIKATYPTITKLSNDKDEVTAQIGDTVPFTITGKVPDTTNFETYTYRVSDNMSDGLTLIKEVSVKIGGTEINVTPSFNTEKNPNGFELTLTEEHFQGKTVGDPIVIEYSATVNEKAVKIVAETNSAILEYSNDPADPDEMGENPPETVKVYTYFFDLVKTDSDNKLLDGAQFKLYDAAAEGNKIALVLDGNFYRPAVEGETPADAIVVTDGQVAVKGLSAEKTYWLEETLAPEGYNLLTERKMVSLNVEDPADSESTIHANLAATVDEEANTWTEGGVQVINLTGAELPETGGIGTTIFYAMGGLLVVGAGILLVTKKRMGA